MLFAGAGAPHTSLGGSLTFDVRISPSEASWDRGSALSSHCWCGCWRHFCLGRCSYVSCERFSIVAELGRRFRHILLILAGEGVDLITTLRCALNVVLDSPPNRNYNIIFGYIKIYIPILFLV